MLSKINFRNSTSKITPADIISAEAVVGGTLFADINSDENVQFFCLDEHTWIYQSFVYDPKTKSKQTINIRYNITTTDILKSVNGGTYQRLSDIELLHFLEATELYQKTVVEKLYKKKLKKTSV